MRISFSPVHQRFEGTCQNMQVCLSGFSPLLLAVSPFTSIRTTATHLHCLSMIARQHESGTSTPSHVSTPYVSEARLACAARLAVTCNDRAISRWNISHGSDLAVRTLRSLRRARAIRALPRGMPYHLQAAELHELCFSSEALPPSTGPSSWACDARR